MPNTTSPANAIPSTHVFPSDRVEEPSTLAEKIGHKVVEEAKQLYGVLHGAEEVIRGTTIAGLDHLDDVMAGPFLHKGRSDNAKAVSHNGADEVSENWSKLTHLGHHEHEKVEHKPSEVEEGEESEVRDSGVNEPVASPRAEHGIV